MGADEDRWVTHFVFGIAINRGFSNTALNPKFSRDDLKGLIFLAQKKIDLYKNKLLNLETDFDAKRVQALQVNNYLGTIVMVMGLGSGAKLRHSRRSKRVNLLSKL